MIAKSAVDRLAEFDGARRRFDDAVAARDRLEAELPLSDMKQLVADHEAQQFVDDLEAMGEA